MAIEPGMTEIDIFVVLNGDNFFAPHEEVEEQCVR